MHMSKPIYKSVKKKTYSPYTNTDFWLSPADCKKKIEKIIKHLFA